MAGAVYWVGDDGNVYTKGKPGEVGVHNEGKAALPAILGGSYATLTGKSGSATRIANPGNPGATSSTAPAGGGGGGGSSGPVLPDKSNDIALQNAGLSAIDSQTNTGISSINSALGGLMGQYDTERGTNEKNYTDNSNQNQTNLQKNKQSALVNAAQGRQGLNGTLASLGALNGSGIQLADRAVQKGANDDLSGAADTYGSNQSGLDTSIGTFRQEDDRRRQDANTAAENARTNVRNNAAQNRLKAFTSLADDYSAMGNGGEAAKYTSMAAALMPEIAATSIPQSNLSYQGAAFTPATLASYLAGANSTAVTAAPAGPGETTGGLVAVSTPQKKKELQTA